MKKQIAGFLAATMLTTLIPTVALASNYTDMPTDWSKAGLEAAISNGLLKGDNGKIMPNAFLTRAQMATMVNRAFGTTEKASLSNFVDVPSSAWYYDDMAKAVHMQTFMGSGNQLNPDSFITREEAFAVLARAFKLSEENGTALNGFSDKDSVSSWAKGGISALVSAGYVSGFNGQINPKQNITRAEFAKIMDNLVKIYIQKAETYSHDAQGNVMVNVPGAVLKNMTITGNLIIGDGVGNGDVTLENVVVTGTTIVRGGGVHSIRITGNSDLKNIVVVRVDGEVRVYAENGTQVGTVVVDGKDDVIVEGKVGDIKVDASNVQVIAKNATIGSVILSGDHSSLLANDKVTIKSVVVNAKGSEIVAEKGSTIKEVLANQEGAKISGTGTVSTVQANANNVVVSTPSTAVTAAQGTTGVMAGTSKVEAGKTANVSNSAPSTGGGGGGGSSSSNVAVKEIAVTSDGNVTSIAKGSKLQMRATISPDNASNKSVTWSVINGTGTATIDTSGLLTATKEGTVTVRATAKDGSGKYAEKAITVTLATQVLEILSQEALGLPTSEVKVKVDSKEVSSFELYFDGKVLASTINGKVVVASAVLKDLSRVQIKIGNDLLSDSNNQLNK